MRSSSIYREYVWLMSLIKRAGRISFAEISRRWEVASINESGQPMSRTTFNRHRNAIEEIFDIAIECDSSDGYRYYIDNSSQDREDSILTWTCDSLAMGTMLSDFKSLQSRIALEPIPTAGNILNTILEAMSGNFVLEIVYNRIACDVAVAVVQPFAVKLFKQRWYLLAKLHKTDKYRLYSLERIREATIKSEQFEMPVDFDVNDYFKDIYGVMSADGVETQRVVIRAYGRDQFYLEELPMHHSQRFVNRTDIYTDYELRLKPTSDFAAAILSRGGWVQVIEPEWFADELRDRADFMLASFEDDADDW